MGILDELDIKVKEIDAEQLKRDLELEEQEEFYRESLRPVMVQAHQYLSDIVQKLNVVKPKITAAYPLNPLSKKHVPLDQSDYAINCDSESSPHQITITCKCTLAQPIEFYLPSKDASLKLTDLLHGHSFYHHRRDRLDKQFGVSGATFSLEGPMHVRIRILAQLSERCVRVIIQNLEEQPVKRYRFAPKDFTPELLERLVRLLLREEDTLVEVVISDDYRQGLRRQLDEERRLKSEEIARALAEREADRLEEEAAKLQNRVKRAVIERFWAAARLVKNIRH